MSNDRKKRPAITSPIGTFRFPKLKEPDFGNAKFPKPDGEYSVQLVVQNDSPEFKKLMSVLQPHYEEAMSIADQQFKELPVGTRKKLGSVKPNDLFTVLYDKETEQPTGEVVFKATAKASGVRKKGPKAGSKWHFKPALFDAKGNYLKNVPDVWSGTKGRINVELSPYFIPGTGAAGLRLQLVGVQIIELVSGGQKSASSMGFEATDGYEHSDDEFPAESQASDDMSDEEINKGDF
jgi:hypothetical protein